MIVSNNNNTQTNSLLLLSLCSLFKRLRARSGFGNFLLSSSQYSCACVCVDRRSQERYLLSVPMLLKKKKKKKKKNEKRGNKKEIEKNVIITIVFTCAFANATCMVSLILKERRPCRRSLKHV